jgi:hypothetical protein
MRLTNAPTNALRTMTNDSADACANAPTNATDARRTRPPTPPRAFVRLRARVLLSPQTQLCFARLRSQASDRTSP